MASIDLTQALTIAKRELRQVDGGHNFVIVPSQTREMAFGWAFAYAPARYLETRNPLDMVPGNGPLIVNRDGSVSFLSSSVPPQVAIDQYLKDWNAAHKP